MAKSKTTALKSYRNPKWVKKNLLCLEPRSFTSILGKFPTEKNWQTFRGRFFNHAYNAVGVTVNKGKGYAVMEYTNSGWEDEVLAVELPSRDSNRVKKVYNAFISASASASKDRN